MEISQFTELISRNCFNPFTRLTVQEVKSRLNQNCGVQEIEVVDEVFNDIVNCTGIQVNNGSIYRFIRIYDMNDNSIDIQTLK